MFDLSSISSNKVFTRR